MKAAAAVGISITVTQVGSEPASTTVTVNVSPIDGAKEWQPAVTVDEDGLLHQLRATLIQARDGSMCELHQHFIIYPVLGFWRSWIYSGFNLYAV